MRYLLQELTVVKTELASAKTEGSSNKEKCESLQSQNTVLSSDLKHSQQSFSTAQVQLMLHQYILFDINILYVYDICSAIA